MFLEEITLSETHLHLHDQAQDKPRLY